MLHQTISTIVLATLLAACSESTQKNNQAQPTKNQTTAVAQSTTQPVVSDDEYQVKHEQGKSAIVDKSGNIIVPFDNYERLEVFSNGLALAKKDGKYGFLDTSGKVHIPFQYEWAREFSDERAAVKVGDKVGFIDTTGKMVIPAQFDFKEGQWGFQDGRVTVYQAYMESIKNPLNGETANLKLHHQALIDTQGNVIVPFGQYKEISYFSEGLAAVSIQQKGGQFEDGTIDLGIRYGYIDANGKLVIPTQYIFAAPLREGLAGVILPNKKYGFINTKGETVIPFEYDNLIPDVFHNGVTTVEKGKFSERKTGKIDKNNNIVEPFK